jgi:hypothetical protein
MALTRRDVLAWTSVIAGTGIGTVVVGIAGCGSSNTTSDGGGSGSGGRTGSGGSGSGSGGSSGSGGDSGGSGGASGSGGDVGSGGSGSGGSGGSGSGGSGSGGAGSGGTPGSGGAGPDASPEVGGGDTATAACNATNSIIGSNHANGPHMLMVPIADVTAGAMKTYSIKGQSAHDHMVTITAAAFTMLKMHNTIMMTSTVGAGHMHTVMVMCV